jgi:hypothetical protein
MGYAVVAIVLGGVIGLATGGRLHNLGEHRLAAWPLLPAGVFLQVLSTLPKGTSALVLLLGSYAALLAFAAANVRLLGMGLVVVGLACNLLVIAVNHGMPVRPSAVIDAGIAKNARDLQDIRLKAKHHYERPSDRLLFLADVIPVRPLREVLSLGDVVMSLGITVVVSTLLRREPTHPQPEPTGSIPSER